MAAPVRFVDESARGFGWIHPHPRWWLERTSHALLADGKVWLVDPTEGAGVDERIRALGTPAAVIQLVDRHGRDCAAFASWYGVPLLEVPDAVPGSPFEVVPVLRKRRWRESALWWPAERTLVVAEAVGTAPHYRTGGERLAVHPLLRLAPPAALRGLAPARLLLGHGAGIEGEELPLLLEDALRSARRRAPLWLASYLRLIARRR
jgi:hypothetical protein